jgi:Flp pilus assembly protein TadG
VKTERGSATVELVLLTPVLMMLALFVVIAGRAGESQIQVHHAADQAARAASMVSPAAMQQAAESAAFGDLANNGVACIKAEVTVSFDDSQTSHSVTVSVECVINSDGLDLLGLSERCVKANSTEVIDRWRVN